MSILKNLLLLPRWKTKLIPTWAQAMRDQLSDELNEYVKYFDWTWIGNVTHTRDDKPASRRPLIFAETNETCNCQIAKIVNFLIPL